VGRDEDNIAANDEAPRNAEEWRVIRAGVDKAHKSWVVVGPIHAVVTNWRALIVILVGAAWLNRPGIQEALQALVGMR